jgi:negative regulator of flagellin synthesis FlgM
MEISDNKSVANFDAYIKHLREGQDAKASRQKRSVSSTAQGDKVQLSPEAREIQQAKSAVDTIPDMDHKRVAQVSEQLEAGTYRIDPSKIAIKMLKEALASEDG